MENIKEVTMTITHKAFMRDLSSTERAQVFQLINTIPVGKRTFNQAFIAQNYKPKFELEPLAKTETFEQIELTSVHTASGEFNEEAFNQLFN